MIAQQSRSLDAELQVGRSIPPLGLLGYELNDPQVLSSSAVLAAAFCVGSFNSSILCKVRFPRSVQEQPHMKLSTKVFSGYKWPSTTLQDGPHLI